MIQILLVDDNPDIRELYGDFLSLHRFEVTTAANGAEALALVDSRPFDLLVIDLVMPDKEGLETIRECQRRLSDVPIIAMSGGGVAGPAAYLSMAKYFGAQMTLRKPFSGTELLAAIEHCLAPSSR